MDEQLPLPTIQAEPQLGFATASPFASTKTFGDRWVATGKDFDVAFDLKQGTISRLVYSGDTLVREGNEPRLTTFRTPCDFGHGRRLAGLGPPLVPSTPPPAQIRHQSAESRGFHKASTSHSTPLNMLTTTPTGIFSS